MKLFDSIRERQKEVPDDDHVAILVVAPLAGSKMAGEVTALNDVRFHDDHGVLEFTRKTGAQYRHISDIGEIALIFVSGNLGEQVRKELPEQWARFSEEAQEQLLQVHL